MIKAIAYEANAEDRSLTIPEIVISDCKAITKNEVRGSMLIDELNTKMSLLTKQGLLRYN